MKRLGLDLPLGELSFKEDEKRSRPPFSDRWIKGELLAPNEGRALFGDVPGRDTDAILPDWSRG